MTSCTLLYASSLLLASSQNLAPCGFLFLCPKSVFVINRRALMTSCPWFPQMLPIKTLVEISVFPHILPVTAQSLKFLCSVMLWSGKHRLPKLVQYKEKILSPKIFWSHLVLDMPVDWERKLLVANIRPAERIYHTTWEPQMICISFCKWRNIKIDAYVNFSP
jgi:hypothetical protein